MENKIIMIQIVTIQPQCKRVSYVKDVKLFAKEDSKKLSIDVLAVLSHSNKTLLFVLTVFLIFMRESMFLDLECYQKKKIVMGLLL